MQALKSIEDKFDLLPLRVKIELFLFPLLIFAALVFFFFKEQNSEVKTYTPKTIDLKSIKMKESVVAILKNIEKYTLENKIDFHLLKKGTSNIKLEVFSSLEKRVLFLKYLEELNSFSKIKSFELFENSLIVEIDFGKFYKKEKILFDDEFKFLKEKEVKKSFIFQAIVGNRVLVNNKWLTVDDRIDSFILKKIKKNKIILENRYEKLILKLYKNESF